MADQTLDQIFESIGSGDEPAGNDAEATPETPEQTAAPETQPERTADDEQSSTGDEASVRAKLDELRQQHPPEVVNAIHQSLEAEWKRGATPKFQKLAELERQAQAYEDISPEQAQWFRSLNQLAVSNPQQAAAALQAEIDRLNALGAQANPYQQMEYLTENERVMAQQLQAQQQQLAELTAANARVEMDRQFQALEKQYEAIPFEERDAVQKRVQQMGGSPQLVPLLWKDMFMDKIIQRVRDKTSQTVARKAGMSPAPSGVSNRASSAPPAVENLSKDQLWDVLASQGGSD